MSASVSLFYLLTQPTFTTSNYDEAIRVMQRAAAVPKNTRINYHDHVRPSSCPAILVCLTNLL
jgi:hypothetical protein